MRPQWWLVLGLCAWAGSARADKAQAQKLYSDGEAAYQRDQFDEAGRLFESSFQQSGIPSIQFNVAQSYRRAYEIGKNPDHLKRAVDYYRAFIRDLPAAKEKPIAERMLAELDRILGARNQALREAEALEGEGARRFALGDYRQALADYKHAYLKNESPPILYKIAQCQERLRDLGDAIISYKSYLKSPEITDRSETERLIADMEQRHQQALVDEARRARRKRQIIIGLSVGAAAVAAALIGVGIAFSIEKSRPPGTLGAGEYEVTP